MHYKFINGMIVYTKHYKINDNNDNPVTNYMIEVRADVHLSESNHVRILASNIEIHSELKAAV